MSKKAFCRSGGRRSKPPAIPYRFQLNPADSGGEICHAAINYHTGCPVFIFGVLWDVAIKGGVLFDLANARGSKKPENFAAYIVIWMRHMYHSGRDKSERRLA